MLVLYTCSAVQSPLRKLSIIKCVVEFYSLSIDIATEGEAVVS